MVQTCPDGSIIRAVRSPKIGSSRVAGFSPHRPLPALSLCPPLRHRRRSPPASCRPAAEHDSQGWPLAFDHDHKPGQSSATRVRQFPSGPGRRPNPRRQTWVLQKSISAATSRHTNIGVNNGDAVGYRFHVAHDCVSFQIKCSNRLRFVLRQGGPSAFACQQ